MRHFIPLTILLVIFSSVSRAQEKPKPIPVWQTRAQSETRLITELALNFSEFDQAVIYAQLGRKWQTTDPARARDWWKKAVDSVDFIPLQESIAHRKLRLDALKAVLRSVGTNDPTLTERLASTLKAFAKKATDNNDRQMMGGALRAVAMEMINSDPRAAKDLFLVGLQAEVSDGRAGYDLPHALIAFRRQDILFAHALFAEALVLARTARNDGLLETLIFSRPFMAGGMKGGTMQANANTPSRMSVAIDRQFWEVVIERLARLPATPEEETQYCQLAVSSVSYQPEQLPRLFPDRAQVVQQAIARCQQVSDKQSEGQKDAPQTVDEMLALARKQTSTQKRVEWLWRAAEKAAAQKDYAQAVSILDDMTKDERTFATHWERWRALYAAAGAQRRFAQKEYGPAHQMLDAVPTHLAASAWIECLRDFAGIGGRDNRAGYFNPEVKAGFKASKEEAEILLNWLREARMKLQQAEFSSSEEAASKAFTLVLLYASLAREEAVPVLQEAVRLLNQQHVEEVNAKDAAALPELDWWHQVDLPPGFVKEAFGGIQSAVNELAAKNLQIRLHLGLLENALTFWREESAQKQNVPNVTTKKKPAAKP